MQGYVCVCVRARTTERARVGYEKQVPACRVPRGRLDSEAATPVAGSTEGSDEQCGCVKCRSRSLASLPTPNTPRALSLSPRRLRERTNTELPPEHRRAAAAAACLSLSTPTENQYVGRSVLSPAKSQFLHTASSPVVLFLTPMYHPVALRQSCRCLCALTSKRRRK